MSAFLTIRGNILLVNLLVIGLILWLALSFLFVAADESNDADLLQRSIETVAIVSQTSASIAREHRYFLSLMDTVSPVSIRQHNTMKAELDKTSHDISVMLRTIKSTIAQPGFVSKIPATQENILDNLNAFEARRNQWIMQLDLALSHTLLPAAGRDHAFLQNTAAAQLKAQTEIATLATSLKYLPSFNAAAFVVYSSLLDEIKQLEIDLARQYLSGNRAFALAYETADGDLGSAVSDFQFTQISETIEQRLANIVRLALSSSSSISLHEIALKVRNLYLHEYLPEKLNAATNPELNNVDSKTDVAWRSTLAELDSLLHELEDSTRFAARRLADNSTARTYRNFIIDVLLVFLCFLIAFASIVINRRVKRHAYNDGLTSLANRLNFESALTKATASELHSHAVIFLDLNRFKSINDNYGHAIGDELLVEVANRLRALCKSSDLLARLGGDEFAILLQNIDSEAAVNNLANSMVSAIEEVVHVQGLNLKVGASAGISIAPQDCTDGVELLRNADIAMYHTKTNSLSKVFRYNQSIAADYEQRLMLEQDLKKGLENSEFHLVYQPKVCTRTGRVKSVEALLRWKHPERGQISPVDFIPVAEDTGLMGQIGFWVLSEACRELAILQAGTLEKLQVAVNISAQQFSDENFISRISQSLEENNLNASSLTLEVTESIVMNDISRVIALLNTLQEMGIDIAVDDFGTGYSSLQYLQELPLNTLKIDRAFITALDHCEPNCSVANSIVQMASLFNLETVAEGVETIEQDSKVRALGVNHIQGYRYSRPVSVADLTTTILEIEAQFHATDLPDLNRAA